MRTSKQDNPKRLLWLNNGWWWMRWQPFHPQITERMAINLKTKEFEEAQRKRDEIIDRWIRGIVPRKGAA
jgi:hypothetical protein